MISVKDWVLPSPVQELELPNWAGHIQLAIKRDDLIHPIVSGNKARKLESFITRIPQLESQRIVSMGGNRSNFLHALAYVCFKNQVSLKAYIRGPEPTVQGATLRDLARWGVELEFVSRKLFRNLREDASLSQKISESQQAVWVPEGGSDADALLGLKTAIDELSIEPDWIFVPVGTGCTALGLATSLVARGWKTRVIGVVVLKGAESLSDSLHRLAESAKLMWPENLLLEHGFCDKGFGRVTETIQLKQQEYESLWDIPLEPVYTVKMCQAFEHYARQEKISEGSKVLLWHTGGLQGRCTDAT